MANGTLKSTNAFSLWLFLGALVIGAYFIFTEFPPYLIFSEESYGAYYWPRVSFLFPHLLCGLIAIVIGPFQFWPRIRNKYLSIHRISGKIYLGSVFIGGIAGMALALTSGINLPYAGGLFSLGLVWMLTSGMAYVAVRKRNILQHKQWMIRSYVVTFAFVTFRLGFNVMDNFAAAESPELLAFWAWACWALPLLGTEIVLQGKQIFIKSHMHEY